MCNKSTKKQVSSCERQFIWVFIFIDTPPIYLFIKSPHSSSTSLSNKDPYLHPGSTSSLHSSVHLGSKKSSHPGSKKSVHLGSTKSAGGGRGDIPSSPAAITSAGGGYLPPASTSPLCFSMCLFRSLDRVKALLHVTQTCGFNFTHKCVFLCRARVPEVANSLSHVLQTYGFSPECVRICTSRMPDVVNALLHVLQTCDLFDACRFRTSCSAAPRYSSSRFLVYVDMVLIPLLIICLPLPLVYSYIITG